MAYAQHNDIIGARFRALGDATRRQILEQLRGGARTVGDIAENMDVSRPAVSQHLKALQEAGLVRGDWNGTRHYFTLDASSFVDLRNYFDQLWQEALQAFAQHVRMEESRIERKRRKR